MSKLMIIDDEINIIKTLRSILEDEGYDIVSGGSGSEAFSILEGGDIDLAILDIWLPDIDGIDLLQKIKETRADLAVIMISGHGSIDIAVTSTKMGAFDFIVKPPSMERVITSVKNALEQTRLKKENLKLKRKSYGEDDMIGSSPKIMEIREIIEKAAKTNARVFITGESGTGKELIARAIYQNSNRSEMPFVKVNCAAIPDDLIESELFGHEMGAFTGAINRRKGKFEVANKGTIFLDEVCDMSLSVQAKVLRVLQEQQFERVGGNEEVNVDVRVIAATNIDIRKAIEENKFREDLYFRLNVIPILAPSLADRAEDLPFLVEYFMNKFSVEHGIGLKDIDEPGMNFLVSYGWPGNVRELKNIIERLLIMVPREVITGADIKKYIESYDYDDIMGKEISSLKNARQDFEKNYIITVLRKNDRNITQASKDLGIERTNLHRKIKLYNIDLDKI